MKTVRPGIRKKENGSFIATKSIDGNRHYKEFQTLREAELWKNKFHPLANKKPEFKFTSSTPLPASNRANGEDVNITVKEVYEAYLKGPLNALGVYQQYTKPNRMKRFLPPIFSVRLADLRPEVITELLNQSKIEAKDNYGRRSFKQELKYFKSILNWYRSERDFSFTVPITEYHDKIAVISRKEVTKKYISIDEMARFIDKLPFPLNCMAELQFLYGLRIAEVCALTPDVIDFKNRKIYIRQTITWVKDIPKAKTTTKTEDEAELDMSEDAEIILRKLEDARPSSSRYFFHHKGKLPKYRPIVDAYNVALKEAGIFGVTGTHFIRHTAGTISRKFGGIDAAQALLRHKSSAMAQHYAKLDVNEKSSQVVIHAEKLFREARATNATKQAETLKISGT